MGAYIFPLAAYRCESWTIWQSLLGLAALWRNVALVTDSTKETILVARPSASRTFMPNVSECSVFASPLVAHAPPSRNHVPHHPFLLTLLPFDIVKVSHFPFHNAVLLPDFSSFLASQYISISHLFGSRYSLKISLTFEFERPDFLLYWLWSGPRFISVCCYRKD